MKVFIVDDEDGVRKLFKYMLRGAGHEGVFAENVASAQAALDAMDSCDMLITDHKLPDGSGLDVARRFRAKFAKAKILLSSGAYDVEKLAAEAPEAAICGVLKKPFDPDEALAQIEKAAAA